MPTIPRAPQETPFGQYIQRAVAFAQHWHQDHFRKRARNGIYIPYLTHSLDTLKQCWAWGTINPVIAQAMPLHDTVEDTDATIEMVRAEFGDEVADLVAELTLEVPDNTPKEIELQLKAEYMETFDKKSLNALVGKLSDRYCNVKDFYISDPGYAPKYLKKATSLLKAKDSRRLEIAREFGEDAIVRIDRDFSELEKRISA